jgi:hypothetical protein|tara:strand:+ start:1802 stop:2623 length:822 start_codon:yes stop_codon:yes gene_type:complete
MPLFSSKLALTTAASSSGTALANVEFVRGAFYSVEKVSDLDTIPVERIAHDQIVWVESSSATYQATFIPADFETTFVDSASWGVFTGFGGGGGETTALNAFTSSIQAEVNNLQAATSSYVTLSQTSSMTVLSASYAKSASIEILTEISSSHAQQADTASYISPGLGISFENDSVKLDTGSTHFTNAVQALSDTSIFALTGSDFSTTNKLQITGSLSLQLDTSGDELAIYSGSEKKFSITNEGILRLTTQSASPTAIKGGMYLDSNYDLYIGQD